MLAGLVVGPARRAAGNDVRRLAKRVTPIVVFQNAWSKEIFFRCLFFYIILNEFLCNPRISAQLSLAKAVIAFLYIWASWLWMSIGFHPGWNSLAGQALCFRRAALSLIRQLFNRFGAFICWTNSLSSWIQRFYSVFALASSLTFSLRQIKCKGSL